MTLRLGIHHLLWLLLLFLAGCASNPELGLSETASPESKSADPTVRILDDGKLKFSLQVLSQQQVRKELGIDLTTQRIRGIWVEIDNDSDSPYWLVRSSLDWDYYPPNEILYSYSGKLEEKEFEQLRQKLKQHHFRNPVPAHSHAAGYIFISSNHLNRVAQLFLIQASLRSSERFWDIRVPKIDSIFDNSLVPRPSWSPGVPPQHRKLVAATHRSPI